MTLTRRQTLIGAAATVVAAALPAVKASESWAMEFIEEADGKWRLVSCDHPFSGVVKLA
jgi:hypothetical protein